MTPFLNKHVIDDNLRVAISDFKIVNMFFVAGFVAVSDKCFG